MHFRPRITHETGAKGRHPLGREDRPAKELQILGAMVEDEIARGVAVPAQWKVLITARSFFEGSPEPADLLQGAGVEVIAIPGDRPLTDSELATRVGKIDGIIAGVDRIGPQTFAAAHPRLKVVARNGVGIEGIDLKAATHTGVVVTNAPGVNTDAVADLVIGLMSVLTRHILQAHDGVRVGRWDRVLGHDLFRKTLGLVGFGKIAQAVARRARGFEMRMLAVDIIQDKHAAAGLDVRFAPLSVVIAEADFVSLHVPLTPQTHHLIGQAELRQMKPTAYLINTARGGVVDEHALAQALHERWIAGAAADVFEQEPPVGSPLLQAPRLLLTPHIGAHTYEATARGALVAVQNLLAVLNGQHAPNVVNPEVYGSPPR
ncbi:MAG: phosphoglycerate dehydrogenase [Armatimonadetes bacterium]|nr:phosphoglycerate dehydrogenase [Armatimonadota bacterium]MBI2972520.1 phosphoglycerate dehydrogenase [Armatimonadota bacterium]